MANKLYAATLLLVCLSATAVPGRQVFLPGLVSTSANEVGGAFMPDGHTFYFSRFEGVWGSSEAGRSTIYVTRLGSDGWQVPVPVDFSGEFDDSDVSISPDGSRLYFTSTRVYAGKVGDDNDIWMTRRDGHGWGKPVPLPEGINSAAEEYSPVQTSSGRLYFASARPGGFGQGDIYVAEPAAGSALFEPAENLGRPVNTEQGERNVTVAPDESFLIFEASGRTENVIVSGDLYVSPRGSSGWGEPVNLHKINTEGSDLMASLMPGGERIIYSSTGGHRERADLYTASLAEVMPQDAASSGLNGMLAVISRSNHEIVFISPSDWKVVERVPVGKGPHEVAVDTKSASMIVPSYGIYPEPHGDPIGPSGLNWFNGPKGPVSKVDPETGRRVEFESSLLGFLISPDGQLAFVTLPRLNRVAVRDVRTRERVAVIDNVMEGDGMVWIESGPGGLDVAAGKRFENTMVGRCAQ